MAPAAPGVEDPTRGCVRRRSGVIGRLAKNRKWKFRLTFLIVRNIIRRVDQELREKVTPDLQNAGRLVEAPRKVGKPVGLYHSNGRPIDQIAEAQGFVFTKH